MKFTITMELGNAAFGDEPQYEVGRILRKLADAMERGLVFDVEALWDYNGNHVGQARFDEEDEE